MQVKKFEAQTMKEVLEMVKGEMGPEAIILSVRDNAKKFGLLGGESVEVTAAISEKILEKKKTAEEKIGEERLELFRNSPAKEQKQFINKVYEESSLSNRGRKYVDIDNEPVEIEVDGTLRLSSYVEKKESPPISPSPSEVDHLRKQVLELEEVIHGFKKESLRVVTPHPGAEFGLSYELSPTYQKLTQSGLSKGLTAKLLVEAQKKLSPIQLKNSAFVDAWAVRHIMEHLRVVDKMAEEKVHIFVGPEGQGKTSALVKMASHLIVKEKKKVAIISGDTGRVGTSDQLKVYAQILNAPFGVIKGEINWDQLLTEMEMVDHILVDMPGLQLKDISEVSYLRRMLPTNKDFSRIHYVQSVLMKDEDAFEMARRYKVTYFDDVIFNHLDESSQHGLIYSFQQKFQVPLHSFGVGSDLPEDYELATGERVVDLIFRISK